MNSFVKTPGVWATAITLSPLLITLSDIDTTLRNLYWFNLWFAAEKDMNDIRNNLEKALVSKVQKSKWLDDTRDCVTIASLRESIIAEVNNILTDENIIARASKFKTYKRWVEERVIHSDFSIY